MTLIKFNQKTLILQNQKSFLGIIFKSARVISKITYSDSANAIIEHVWLLQEDFVIEKSIVHGFEFRSHGS